MHEQYPPEAFLNVNNIEGQAVHELSFGPLQLTQL